MFIIEAIKYIHASPTFFSYPITPGSYIVISPVQTMFGPFKDKPIDEWLEEKLKEYDVLILHSLLPPLPIE